MKKLFFPLLLLLILAFSALIISIGFFPELQGFLTYKKEKKMEEKEVLSLFFIKKDEEDLFRESCHIKLKGDIKERADTIFKALINAPSSEMLSPLPDNFRLLDFYMDKSTAVLDLHPSVKDKLPGGSHAELNMLYALVNSLIINIPEINKVQILIDGQRESTLAGHINIRYPLTTNMMIVK